MSPQLDTSSVRARPVTAPRGCFTASAAPSPTRSPGPPSVVSPTQPGECLEATPTRVRGLTTSLGAVGGAVGRPGVGGGIALSGGLALDVGVGSLVIVVGVPESE